ncbi:MULTISPECIES: FliM/FliN family flagellar motor switch protein [Citromicrobium]|uniref:FliM/FliN family flagellar motor switch protein n=1 Tax=Citromicrobium TaxID=72173 RepID=UPI0001DD0CCA|nr:MULTISPECIES: FliM/FliN family flagellar motor switch protein [Citromicrobium]ALG59428.1 flagellar motor switch protein FliM [Citromicrobium sp. JL477]KPM16140.1 flagellar motor switch protein FliM [Citromicrobium sp. JL1351]KPM19397.1 flagellar motor switch protein FliM [Citromicrobium sp. JL31]KPM23781.1 flagellar motor switch protein FliM [Citromicrobium sp. JL2201]
MIETAAPSGTRTAQHCEQLLSNSLETIDVAGDFARLGTRLARALQPRFAALFDTRKLEVELVDTASCAGDALGETLGSGMHHARFALPVKGLGILVSAKIGALIGEFDRMLGGDGDAPEDARALPASADRFSRQIEGEVLAACAEASGRDDLAAAARGTVLREIVPSSAQAPVHLATFAVSRPDTPKFMLTIAVCETTFVQFAGEAPVGKPVRRTLGELPLDRSPLAHVEMTATATLVDMTLPLHRIAGLQVGTLLPVSIHRSVPLSIADITIALGAVGALDDRVALEIHYTALAKDI